MTTQNLLLLQSISICGLVIINWVVLSWVRKTIKKISELETRMHFQETLRGRGFYYDDEERERFQQTRPFVLKKEGGDK